MVGIQNKLLTGTIIDIHLEKEAFVVKNTGNIRENIEKSSKVAPLDGTLPLRKQAFTLEIQQERLCDTSWKFQGQKSRSMEIPHQFFFN